IIAGCHPGDCHYTSGNYYTRRRLTLLMSMLDFLGVDKERLRLEWVSAAEGNKFAEVMTDFVATITTLGANVKLRDLRCQK
ncbi:MAG: hydrogenase iron-sulfur subunit, partial [Acidaminococcaceae bacterium]